MVYNFKCGFLSDGYNNASEGEREESQSGQFATGRMESEEHYNSAWQRLHAVTCMEFINSFKKSLFGTGYSSDNSGDGPTTNRKGKARGKQNKRKGGGNGAAKISPAMMTELNKLIKKNIEKQEEIKIAFGSQTCNVGGYNYTNWASNQIHVLTPYDGTFGSCVINQGTGQADRIGNRVKIRRVTLRLASWVMPYQAVTNPTPTPLMVRVWIFTRKDFQNIPTNLPNFFQAGNSSIAPIGNITDYLYPINNDVYTVYKTVDFKLGTASWTGATGGQATYGYYSNNDFELCDLRTIDVTPFFPSNIEWNDTTALPFSRPIFMTLEAVCADGTTQSSGTYGMQTAMQTVLEYSDA